MFNTNVFNLFEENHNLFEDECLGFYYWPYLRFSIYMMLSGAAVSGKKPSALTFGDSIKLIKNLTINHPLLRSKNADILFIAHPRRLKDGDLYKCIYTDDLADLFGNKALTAEFLYGLSHRYPEYNQNRVLNLDYVDIFPAISFPIYEACHKRELKILKSKADSLFDFLQKDFPSEMLSSKITKSLIEKLLAKRFYWHKKKKMLLRGLIRDINPKLIIEVVSYETNKMITNELAHEFKIPVIELQHGVISPGHIAYNYPSSLEHHNYMPDKIYLFSDYWKTKCAYPIGDDCFVPVGYPYLEKQIKRYPKKVKKNGPFNILVITQPAVPEMFEWIEKLNDYLKSKNIDYRIIIKPHPADNIANLSRYAFLADDNICLMDKTSNLYKLFSEADCQVGAYSTALYEGIECGLPTILCDLGPTKEYMLDCCAFGHAVICNDGYDLFSKVVEVMTISDLFESDVNPFFKKNALKNMYMSIKKELEQTL